MTQMPLESMSTAANATLELQLKEQRRRVDFDTFDIFTQQLMAMLTTGQIWMAPVYQRKFRWDEGRCSKFIESLMLGIPVPSLFMATNADNTWEVVDGGPAIDRTHMVLGGDESLREEARLEAFTCFDRLGQARILQRAYC